MEFKESSEVFNQYSQNNLIIYAPIAIGASIHFMYYSNTIQYSPSCILKINIFKMVPFFFMNVFYIGSLEKKSNIVLSIYIYTIFLTQNSLEEVNILFALNCTYI